MLVPALGESWGQASSTRVALYWEGRQRRAHLLKASWVPPGLGSGGARGRAAAAPLSVAFDVTVDGVCSAAAAAGDAGGVGGGGGGWPQYPPQQQQQYQQQYQQQQHQQQQYQQQQQQQQQQQHHGAFV